MGSCCTQSLASENQKNLTLEDIKLSYQNFINVSKEEISSRYMIERKIWGGEFSEVFIFKHKKSSLQRAVKIIKKENLHDQQTDTNNKLVEFECYKKLDHPNILKCYEIFDDKWKFYIVMEYCLGGDLFEKTKELEIFNEAQASKIVFQILSAVSYCHNKEIIHRDLKPENIFLESGSDLSIKIADFGRSQFINPKKKVSGVFGGDYYVAPEVLGKNGYTEKCDIWSVGIIMFILLTGVPPYSEGEKEIFEQIKKKPFNVDEVDYGLSKDSKDLLKSLLKVNPSERISASEALEHRWFNLYKENLDSLDLTDTLARLSSFTRSVKSAKLKSAVLIFLASQVATYNETKILKQEFAKLDLNNDGKISRDELKEFYRTSMDHSKIDEEIENIIDKHDLNKNGAIDYTEFLVACMNNSITDSRTNLDAAFRRFDQDDDGKITSNEIKSVLGAEQQIDDTVWIEIISEVDQNSDGVIDMKEFYSLMSKKLDEDKSKADRS